MSVSSQKALAEQKVGKQYGNITVLARIGTTKTRQALFKCVCVCGEVTEKPSSAFNNPNVSCGCMTKELQAVGHLKHGQCRRSGTTKLYRTWQSIFARCCNPKNKAYKYYGGKGISVCERWAKFDLFATDIGEPPTSIHELDRIDPLGDYEPSNCRWITKQENIARVVHKRNEKGVFVE